MKASLLIQHITGDARQHDDYGHQQFQEGGEQETGARRGKAGPERALGDVLIAPPVAEMRDPHSPDQDRQSGQIQVVGIVPFQDHVKMIVRVFPQQVESVHDSGCSEFFRNQIQGEVGRHQSAEHEKEYLNHIGVTDDLHSAEGDDHGKNR